METSSSQQHCVAVSCVDTGVVPDGGVMSTTMPPGETGCSGVALGSPVTTCKEDLEVIWVTVISNGHFNMPLGITNMPLRFIDHTVDHNSYRYWGLL